MIQSSHQQPSGFEVERRSGRRPATVSSVLAP